MKKKHARSSKHEQSRSSVQQQDQIKALLFLACKCYIVPQQLMVEENFLFQQSTMYNIQPQQYNQWLVKVQYNTTSIIYPTCINSSYKPYIQLLCYLEYPFTISQTLTPEQLPLCYTNCQLLTPTQQRGPTVTPACHYLMFLYTATQYHRSVKTLYNYVYILGAFDMQLMQSQSLPQYHYFQALPATCCKQPHTLKKLPTPSSRALLLNKPMSLLLLQASYHTTN